MNQIQQNTTIGKKFEERFLQEFQARFKTAKTSRGTDFMFMCDIVHDDCLIEVKGTRDNYNETTVETFSRICKYGLKDFKANGREKGLFFQIREMLKFERSMVIAGTYKIQANKLYNYWLRNPDQAWSNYTEYKIMTHWSQGSTFTRIPAKKFWDMAEKSWSLRDFKGQIEDLALAQVEKTKEFKNHWYGMDFISAFCQLGLNISPLAIESYYDGSFKEISIPKKIPQTWIEKEKQANLEPVEEVAEPVEEVAEPVEESCVQYDFDISKCISNDDLLIIKDMALKNHCYSDISLAINRHATYLTKIVNAAFSPEQGYQGTDWDKFRDWLKSHTPTDTDTKKIKALSNTKENMTAKIKELQNEIVDLKAQLDNQRESQVDETTNLKLEAYQAEIKKLQKQLEDYKAASSLKTEEPEKPWSNKLVIKAQAEQIKSDGLLIKQLETKLANQEEQLNLLRANLNQAEAKSKAALSNEDVQFYRKIINHLLESQC